MIRIYVVDRTAESRTALSHEIEKFTRSNTPDIQLLPPIEVTPVDLHELKHRNKPELVIIGPELAQSETSRLAELSNQLNSVATLLVIPESVRSLPFIERMARIGLKDFITANTTATDFLEKLICLSRSERKSDSGNLILVDSAKGGVGVSTLVAALGEALAGQKIKTALLDLDFQTQSLSRFLRARPYINENLALLLAGKQAITRDFVMQTLTRVWPEEPFLSCITAAPYMDALVTRGAPASRPLLSILEELLHEFQVLIVDVASAQGGVIQTLYRFADQILILLNGEPATAFATISNSKSLIAYARPDTKVYLLNSESQRPALSARILHKELAPLLERDSVRIANTVLPFSRAASSWPASGGTAYSLGSSAFRSAIDNLLSEMELVQQKPLLNTGESAAHASKIRRLFALPAVAPNLFRLPAAGWQRMLRSPLREAGQTSDHQERLSNLYLDNTEPQVRQIGGESQYLRPSRALLEAPVIDNSETNNSQVGQGTGLAQISG